MLRTYRWPLVATVAIYLFMALLGRTTARGEIFPFFSWDLFSTVPAVQQVRPAVHLIAVDGEQLEDPLPLAGSRYLRGTPIVLSRLANDLVAAIRSEPEAVPELRAALEANHLPETPTIYALVLEHFDPLRRFESGEVETTEVVRWGTAGADPLSRWRLDAAGPSLVTPAGAIPIQDDRPVGFLEAVEPVGEWVRVNGWAGDRVSGELPDQLLVLSGSDVVYLGGVNTLRPPVAEATGHPELAWSGYVMYVPAERIPDPAAVTVVARFDDGTAALVPQYQPPS